MESTESKITIPEIKELSMDQLKTKPTEELLQILKEGSNLHSEQKIMDVEVILQERDVQYHVPYKKSKRRDESNIQLPNKIKNYGFIYAPILVAISFIILSYFFGSLELGRTLDRQQVFYLNIGIIIVMRIIVLAIVDHYNSKLNITGPFWYILGLVFGTLSLIIYNIYLWVRGAGSGGQNEEILDSFDELE